MTRFVVDELRLDEITQLHRELHKLIGERDIAFHLRSTNPSLSPSLLKQYLFLSPVYVTKVTHGYVCIAGVRSYFLARLILDKADTIPVIIDSKHIKIELLRDQFLMECLYQTSFCNYLVLGNKAKNNLVKYVKTLSDEERSRFFIDTRKDLAEVLDYSERSISRAKK